MAMTITSDCINCGACDADCPNTAISEGDPVYLIDWEKCTECVGHSDKQTCIEVCPVEGAITPDPAHVESREVLQAKYAKMH